MLEILKNLEGWKKLTGAGTIVILIFLLILYVHDDKEAIELPSTINELKENATEQVMEEGTEAGENIVKDFNKMGKEIAEDVEDPVAKNAIIVSMTLAGFMLALFVILSLYEAVRKAFK